MLKVLLKKQLAELKYSYFRDRKTGKIKSKKAIIGYSVLYFFLYICFVFSIFAITMFLKQFIPDQEDVWIICSLMAFLTVFLSTFINMLITKGILYDARDNELLLSLPIEDKYIILSRMFNVLINSFIYTSIMWLPVIIHCLIYCEFNILIIVYSLLTLIVLSLIVCVLSCVFGHLIAIITKKFKSKNIVATILTLLLLAGYYVIYFNANKIMTSLLAQKEKFIEFLNTKGFLISIVGKAVTGDTINMLLSLGIYTVIAVIGFVIILSNYRKQLISTPSFAKKEFKGNYSKQNSVAKTLINRELKMFFSISTYTVNCGLGVIILVASAVALIIFKNQISELLILTEILPIIDAALPIVLLSTILMIVGMDTLSVPAVSLEGKNYWLIRSLPVSSYDVLNSKRLLQFRMHIIPAVLLALICTFVFEIDGLMQVLFILGTIFGVTFITYYDLFLGIKGANLKWTDPTFVIKSSGSVFVAVFGDMLFFPAICLLFIFVLYKYVNLDSNIFMICMIVMFALGSYLLDRWVRKRGVKLFEDLG